jgi:hypothetical protein
MLKQDMHDIIILNDLGKNVFLRCDSIDAPWKYSYDHTLYHNLGDGPYVIKNMTTDKSEVTVKFIVNELCEYEFYITKISQFFIINGDNIIFDGGRDLYNPDNKYPAPVANIRFINNVQDSKVGLFQNGDKDTRGYNSIQILNMDYYSEYPNFHPGNGRFIQPFFGNDRKNFTLNCINNFSNISGNNTCGIAGDYIFQNSQNVVINNCINFGTIGESDAQMNCFGVIGRFFMNGGSDCVVNNCYNFGAIQSKNSSGVIGDDAFCESRGNISITKCYNTGAINGQFSAGLIGFHSFNRLKKSGNIEIKNCFNSGKISLECAGLIGSYNFNNIENSNYTIDISNSYNNSNITGDDSSGLLGNFCFNNCSSSAQIYNCYFNGMLKDKSYNYGLIGNYTALNSNCTIKIKNCYASSNLDDPCTLIGYVYDPQKVIIENCAYSLNWNSSLARETLLFVADRQNKYNNFNIDDTNFVYLDSSNFFYPNVAYILTAYKTDEIYFPKDTINHVKGNYIPSSPYNKYQKAQFLYVNSESEFKDLSFPFVEYSQNTIYFEGGIMVNINLESGDYKSIFVVLNKYGVQRGYEIFMLQTHIISTCTILGNSKVQILRDGIETELEIPYLQIGDLVKIYDNTYKPVLYLYYKTVDNYPLNQNNRNNGDRPNTKLYYLDKNEYPNLINENLYLMGNQNLLVPYFNDNETETYNVMDINPASLLHKNTNLYKLDVSISERFKDHTDWGMHHIFNIVIYHNDNEPPYFYVNGNALVESLPLSFISK